jgi:hypothetical protein
MSDEPYAKIYVAADREEVKSLLVTALGADVLGNGYTVTFDSVEVDVRRNDDRDDRRFAPTYDGFIYSQTYLDVTGKPDASYEGVIKAIARILEVLWDSKWTAVAAADFEDELPHKGGVELLSNQDSSA